MDYVLSEPWRLDDVIEVMTGTDVIFVGVHCSIEELRRRERVRRDRLAGTAEAQARMVHVGREYDIEVDTSTDTPEVCCARIRDFLKRNPSGPARAFDRLRTRP